MPNVIPPDRSPISGVLNKVREYIGLRSQIDDLTKQQSILKTYLSNLVDESGEEDDKGHLWLELEQEVDGYRSLQRQRRVSQRLDEEEAAALLKEKGLDSRCYSMLPVLNQDEVMACLYEGLLTEEEVDKMFPKAITWAFVPVKG